MSTVALAAGRFRGAARRAGAEVSVWLRPAAPVLRRLAAPAATVSPLGRTVAAGALLAWLVGWRTGWHELLVVAAAGLLALAGASLYTLGATNLAITVEVGPRRVRVNERATGSVTITNTSRRRLLPLRVELPVGTRTLPVEVPGLAGGRAYSPDPFVIATARRGVIVVGPAWSVRGDPLGLLRRAVRWTAPVELFVHPQTVPLQPLGAGYQRDLEGHPTTDLSNSDVAFHALRTYVTGDDQRHVHWRTVARTGTLMVRQFTDTRTASVVVLLDAHADGYADADEFELAVSVAGSVAVRAIADDLSVCLLAGDQAVTRASRHQALDALARVRFDTPRSDLGELGTRARRIAADASIAVLVTGSASPVALLRRHARRFDPQVKTICVRVVPGQAPAVQPLGGVDVLTVPTLADLPAAMRVAAKA